MSRTKESEVFRTVILEIAGRVSGRSDWWISRAISRVESAIPIRSVQSDETIRFQLVGRFRAALKSMASLNSPCSRLNVSTITKMSSTNVSICMPGSRPDSFGPPPKLLRPLLGQMFPPGRTFAPASTRSPTTNSPANSRLTQTRDSSQRAVSNHQNHGSGGHPVVDCLSQDNRPLRVWNRWPFSTQVRSRNRTDKHTHHSSRNCRGLRLLSAASKPSAANLVGTPLIHSSFAGAKDSEEITALSCSGGLARVFFSHLFEFRVVVQNFQIRVLPGPIHIRVAGPNCSAESVHGVRLHPQHTESASGIVENIGIGRTHGHGDFH